MEIKERQLDIIEAAGKILTHSGISGLTIKNLAAEMEFSESALYRHFSSKEEIIIALLEYLASGMDKRLSEITAENKAPLEAFTKLFGSQFAYFNENRHYVVAVFSDCLMEESQRINETIMKLMAVKRKYLLQILRDGQQQNIFSTDTDAEMLAHIIIGSFRLQMFQWRVHEFEYDIIGKGDQLIRSLLHLITKKSI